MELIQDVFGTLSNSKYIFWILIVVVIILYYGLRMIINAIFGIIGFGFIGFIIGWILGNSSAGFVVGSILGIIAGIGMTLDEIREDAKEK
jgi:hypothetical protein